MMSAEVERYLPVVSAVIEVVTLPAEVKAFPATGACDGRECGLGVRLIGPSARSVTRGPLPVRSGAGLAALLGGIYSPCFLVAGFGWIAGRFSIHFRRSSASMIVRLPFFRARNWPAEIAS
jgi:hypothetical protein